MYEFTLQKETEEDLMHVMFTIVVVYRANICATKEKSLESLL